MFQLEIFFFQNFAIFDHKSLQIKFNFSYLKGQLIIILLPIKEICHPTLLGFKFTHYE